MAASSAAAASAEAAKFLTFADFDDQDPDHYGLSASATQVERIFPPEKSASRCTVEGDADTQSQALLNLLLDKKLL